MNQVYIESERLIIRSFQLGDEVAIYKLNSNPIVQKYTGDRMIHSVEQAKELLTNIVFNDYNLHGYGRLAVIYKPDNKLIGFTGFKYLPELSETDLGYRFLPEYWGKGIATESSIMSLNYGFQELGLEKIYAFAEPENKASGAVLKKIGFTQTQLASYPGEEDQEAVEWYLLTKDDYERLNMSPRAQSRG